MTLDARVLEKLAEWWPGEGRQTLAVPGDGHGWSVAVTADRAEKVGCLVWELTVTRTTPAPAGATLRAWTERVASRATGLLETLRLHEVDDVRGEALLRSDTPGRRGDDLYYYEVNLRGVGVATLRRYRGARPGQAREQAAYPVTHEALAKLVADLTADA